MITRSTLIPSIVAAVQRALLPLGAHGLRVAYMGRQIELDDKGGVVSGFVATQASFLTPSGFRREIDVPVEIQAGQALVPVAGIFEGRQAALTQDLFRSINEGGTTYGYSPIGHIYSTPYHALDSYQRVREALSKNPPIRRFTKLYT